MSSQDADYAASLEYEQVEEVVHSPTSSDISNTEMEDANYAASLEYEQAEEVVRSPALSDMSDTKMKDDIHSYTIEKLAKLFTNSYKEVASLIASRKNSEPWETTSAAMMQVLAVFFPKNFESDPSQLQFPVSKNVESKMSEILSIRALDRQYAPLANEVVLRLAMIWDLWTEVIRYAQTMGSGAFAASFYGSPKGCPWIEFIGLATLMAKHYQNIFKLPESDRDDLYEATKILIDVSWLRRWLRSNIPKGGFRRNQGHWKHCWDIITHKAVKDGVLVMGKSNFMPAGWDWEPEPELGIIVDEDSELAAVNEDIDVEMVGTNEEAQGTTEDEEGIEEGEQGTTEEETDSAKDETEESPELTQADRITSSTSEASMAEDSSNQGNEHEVRRAPSGRFGHARRRSSGQVNTVNNFGGFVGEGGEESGSRDPPRADGYTTVDAWDPETRRWIVVNRSDPRSGCGPAL